MNKAEQLNRVARMHSTLNTISATIESGDLDHAENWARHLEMQLSHLRLAMAFEALDRKNEKVGA